MAKLSRPVRMTVSGKQGFRGTISRWYGRIEYGAAGPIPLPEWPCLQPGSPEPGIFEALANFPYSQGFFMTVISVEKRLIDFIGG
jgi:hypothetical protein